MAKTPTWQRKAGQNPNGGLNEAGRRSLKAAGHDIKRPQPEGGSRRDSFCRRMKGMKAKNTSSETANDPDSRINKSLRAWNCHAEGGPVWDRERPKDLGKPEPLTAKEKKSAKASAKDAGRPYPNLVDNMRAAKAGGGGLKAAVDLAKGIIKSYHGSPKQFERFDTGKIGSGVGAQAYGHGLYFSDNPSVARGYRHSTEPATISGRPIYSLYKDIEDKAVNVPIQNASSYYDKLSVLEHLMDKGDALAVRDAASREMFPQEAYDWFRKNVEPNLRTPGGLYEVGIHADPKKFIGLYDELALGDPLRERVASLAERAMRLDEGNPLFRKGQEAMKAVRRQNATGAQMTDALDELLGYQKNPLREFTGISPELKAPEAVSKYLENEGYAGYTYPHGTDAPGPERLNRVVFDPKIIEIMHRYGQGGEVRPEMGSGGSGVKAAVQIAQDIIKAYHGSPHKFDKFDISKIGTGEGAQAFGHGLYFAEAEPVAESYRYIDSRIDPDVVHYQGKPIQWHYDQAYANKDRLDRMRASGPQMSSANARASLWEDMMVGNHPHQVLSNARDSSNGWAELNQYANSIDQNNFSGISPAGHMYEVNINANPEHMLNWDKPLNDQPSFHNVQRYWDEKVGDPDIILKRLGIDKDSTGRGLYEALGGGRKSPENASKTLNEWGVPGIRYLDQGSRDLGQGTSNYVVFNPDIIDILRRYASGGSVDRLHFDDGGLARIEDLIRQAKGEEAATQASHPVGMSSEVEFAPVEINEPMTGAKIPLGRLPAPTAAVANPVANVLAQFGPYAMGPVPAGIAAARDLVSGIREGSGMDVATAALGVPGKVAKYGLPALGAVTDLLSPTEAQAGPYTKFLKELAEKYRPHYDPSAMIKGQPKDKWISDVALSRPIDQMSVKTTDQRNMIPEARIQPIEMAGKAMISGFGDKTPAGYVVTHLNDRKLSSPVNVLGGPAFARDQAAQIDEAYWGSNRSRASALANKGKEAVEKKYDPVFAYITQGPQSQDFSHQMTEMILGQLKKKDMDKKLVEQFDQLMREKEIKKGMPGIPTWPGLTSPKLKQWLMESKEGGAGRAKMAKLMDKSMYLKAPGFADVGAARFATTHPDIMNTPIFSSGHMFSRMDPEGRLITNPKVPHPSYDTLLASPKGKQGYIGGFEYELPPELHFHDYLSGAESGYQSGIRPDLVEKPFTQKTMSLMRETPTVIGTPKWVDMASEYQDIMRYLYGRRP